MNHLSMEQLLAVRAPGLEPGVQTWRDHVGQCAQCQDEFARLEQRMARLRALPTLRPGRDLFGAVRLQAAAERRRGRWRQGALGVLALAASALLAVAVFDRPERELVAVSPETELEQIMSRSRQLENALASFDPDRGVLDGRTVRVAATLEDRVARVDRELEMVNLLEGSDRQAEALRLWRERVGLLGALVDVHVTRARYVGF